MSKLEQYSPNWPANDWADYYRNTYVLHPVYGKPWRVSNVETVTGINSSSIVLKLVCPETEKVNSVPVDKFDWHHLKHPRLGWHVYNGVPVYAIKRPLREKCKGFRYQILDFVVPGYLVDILTMGGNILFSSPQKYGNGYDKYVKTVANHLTKNTKITVFYEDPPRISVGEAISRLESSKDLGIVLGDRDNLLIHNHILSERNEYPYLFLHGLTIAGKVRKDGSIEQVGNVDLAEALYD
jgi:hypothetical protein